MLVTNTKNRVNKKVEVNDIVSINMEKYQITGVTKSGLSFTMKYIGLDPNAKKTETWSKNTFVKRFFFNGVSWSFIRKTKVPNFNYI